MRKIRDEIDKMIDLLDELRLYIGNLDHVSSEGEFQKISDQIVDARDALIHEWKYFQKKIEEFL